MGKFIGRSPPLHEGNEDGGKQNTWLGYFLGRGDSDKIQNPPIDCHNTNSLGKNPHMCVII